MNCNRIGMADTDPDLNLILSWLPTTIIHVAVCGALGVQCQKWIYWEG